MNMKLRARDKLWKCWDKDQEFECHFDIDGDAYVICNRGGRHHLIGPDGYTKDPYEDPDFTVVEEEEKAP